MRQLNWKNKYEEDRVMIEEDKILLANRLQVEVIRCPETKKHLIGFDE